MEGLTGGGANRWKGLIGGSQLRRRPAGDWTRLRELDRTLILGVIGAFVGGLLFGLLGLGPTNLVGELISAVVGAVVFVWLLRYLKRK